LSSRIWLRVVRNLAIAVASTLWLVPLHFCVGYTLIFLGTLEKTAAREANPQGWTFSYMEMAQSALVLTTILLGLTCFGWTFVLVNRLLPVAHDGGKLDKERAH
jgi:hypothetical protein